MNVPGDFVECGVWKGGSTMLMARALQEKSGSSRKIYLYDTFEGMTKPSTKDIFISDKSKAIKLWKKRQKTKHDEWCFSPVDEVKKNMHSTGYDNKKIIFIKGKVEDTIPKHTPKQIAILRLDTDWYKSTYHEMKYLFPLLSKNGVLIIDDYGCWAGVKKAIDTYFKENNITILLHRPDEAGRIAIKLK